MLTIGVLCSGGLGLDTLSKIAREHSIEFVLTDRNSTDIIDFVTQNKIPFYSGNPRKGQGFDFIKKFDVDVIASINYLFLIEEDIINHSNSLTFNIHGSLLPKYRGRTPHVWAIINGENKTGITAHVIDKGCDTGNIIHQIEVPIESEDTGATILGKYVNEYYPLVKMVLKDVSDNTLSFIPQNEEEATYFGKRTPSDGEISWDWPKAVIKNWVRAQAYPYPGAFTFCDNQKIVIDKVSFSEQQVNNKHINGEIIQHIPDVMVKTVNGVLKLDTIRTENRILETGKIFGNENRK